MKQTLTNYVRAGYPGLYLVSHEEQRVAAEFKAVSKETKFRLFAWSVTEGVTNDKGEQEIPESDNPLTMLEKLPTLGEKCIILLRDFHLLLGETNPVLFRKLRDQLAEAKTKNRVIVIVGCQLKLPPELEKEIAVVEYKLPDREQLREVLDTFAAENDIKLNGSTEQILDAAGGLTTIEAENAFALSVVEMKDVVPGIVSREKSNTVKKNGLLEIVEQKITLDDIGGLELLKADLHTKRNLFSKAAREYGLPTPRGQLYVGQAGTGKSMCASACASVFGLPLLKLEAGRIFGSLVGESERNWRTAFSTAKAVAPCVLWIDEVDGLFSGAESSGKTDGGTTMRVIKAVLQDMQFNGQDIFFVFTANDIDGLPDPLIDRLDVWSVDLPNKTEREAIWKIQIEKYGRKSAKFELGELAGATDGFSGRQIEQVWIKAMTLAFNARREPTNADAAKVAKTFIATSITMQDVIEKRRKRLANRAMSASAPEEKQKGGRKVAV
ncbi:MAG: AAA family ATPase [Patescibacteria group bacterium]|nr:AAA family ATPase [Patescibacteria group bacterium]